MMDIYVCVCVCVVGIDILVKIYHIREYVFIYIGLNLFPHNFFLPLSNSSILLFIRPPTHPSIHPSVHLSQSPSIYRIKHALPASF